MSIPSLHPDIVRIFDEDYPDWDALDRILTSGVSPLGSDKEGRDLLAWIVYRSAEVERVRHFIALGVRPMNEHSREWTPLMAAAWQKSPDMVALLLEAGADPNVRGMVGDFRDEGSTAMDTVVDDEGDIDTEREYANMLKIEKLIREAGGLRWDGTPLPESIPAPIVWHTSGGGVRVILPPAELAAPTVHHPDLCPGCRYPRDTPVYLKCPACGHLVCECYECSLWLDAHPILKQARCLGDPFILPPALCPGCKTVPLEIFINATRDDVLRVGLPLRPE